MLLLLLALTSTLYMRVGKQQATVTVNGVDVRSSFRNELGEQLHSIGYSLWIRNSEKDVFFGGTEEEDHRLTVRYNLINRVANVSGDAYQLSVGGMLLRKGCSEALVSKTLGPPSRIEREGKDRILIYDGGRILLFIGPHGLYWFHVSNASVAKPGSV